MSYAGVDYDDSYYLARAREENARLREQVAALEAKVLKLTPKPKEPRGLGAVVKDREGRRWVRDGGAWISAHSEATFDRFSWNRIDAVEVLSQGVSP